MLVKISPFLSFPLRLWLVWIIGCLPVYGYAQAQNTSLLSLEQIFSSNEFSSERFGPAKWIDDGAGYTTLESSDTSDKSAF